MSSGGEGLETADIDEILMQPLRHMEQLPEKELMEKLVKLIKAFNFWLNIPLQKCDEIVEILKLVYNAFLLIDDIEDKSKSQSETTAAHHIYGVPTTINSADYVHYLSLEKVLSLGHPNAIRVFTEQLIEIHRGQGMEIYWRDSFLCPTEEEYIEMAKRKTGGLLGLGVKLMQLFSDNKSDFSEVIAIMGLYFQIRDEYSNLKSKEYTEDKGFFDDLTEGKFSFPIIHSIRSNLDDPILMNIIRQRTTKVELKKYALDIMEETGSFEYCRKVLMDLGAQARKAIEHLGHHALLPSLLNELKIE